MEEDVPSRSSVAELKGRFRDSAEPAQDKPVRRRPPRILQLPKDQQEPPGVTSPLPAKAKRNSGLIEKLQASLVLSPSAQQPSPKSPGFRLLAHPFHPTSTGSAPDVTWEITQPTGPSPTSPVTPSPITEEEGPASFEASPGVSDGSVLSSVNKSRARHSVRRRPPSRRHRKSSSGDEIGAPEKPAAEAEGGREEVCRTQGDTDGPAPKPKQEDGEQEEDETQRGGEETTKVEKEGQIPSP